ncbi:hypothetical protein PCAR4_390081 [Paraburkholderia caribensis]|nr:hypothetical protein PCAR4_390081 [Paraburkholderia caribensis]
MRSLRPPLLCKQPVALKNPYACARRAQIMGHGDPFGMKTVQRLMSGGLYFRFISSRSSIVITGSAYCCA